MPRDLVYRFRQKMQMMIMGQLLPFSSPLGPTDGTRHSTDTVDAPTESHLGAGMHKYQTIDLNVKRMRVNSQTKSHYGS